MLNPYLEKRLYSLPVQPILVEIDPNQLAATLGQITGLKLTIVSQLPTFGFAAIAPVSPSIIKKVNALPGVRMVHSNMVKTIYQLPTPADEWFPTSESRKMLEVEAAFREGYNGEAIKVGVCDTGVDSTHPQLVGTEFYSQIMWPAREMLDKNGHGSLKGDGMVFTTFCGVTTLKGLYDIVKEPPVWDNGAWVKIFRYPIYTYTLTPEGPRPAMVKALHQIPGEYELVEIKTSTGSLSVTPWHPLFILTADGIHEVRADQIEKDDFLVQPATPLKLEPMMKLDTEEAYCLGVMVGDGHIPTKQSYTMGISCSNEPVLDRIKQHWGEDYRRWRNNCWEWRLKDQNLADQLIRWGFPIGVKGDRLHIPTPIAKGSMEVMAAFIAGLLDTDGSAAIDRNRIRLVTTSPGLAKEVRFLLGLLGIPSSSTPEAPSKRGKLVTYTVAIANTAVRALLNRVGRYLVRNERWQKLREPDRHTKGDIIPWSWQDSKAVLTNFSPYTKRTPNGTYITTSGKVLSRQRVIELLEEMAPQDQRLPLFRSIRATRVTKVNKVSWGDYLYDLTVEPGQNYVAGEGGVFFIHNTHCASTVAGKLYRTPLGITVEGVSHSPMVCVKCLGRGIGTGFTSEIINAIATCYDKGAQVISMSLGSAECQGGCEVCPECRMVSSLTARGIIFVIAAGNSGPQENTIGCPGCSPNAITVAAVDRNGELASFSSRGGDRFPLKPDVAAPGVNIYSGTARGSFIDVQEADAGMGFAAISGTSMATPHVAGFIALLKQKFPKITTAQIKQTMAQRGHAKDFKTGWGIPLWSYFR